METLINKKWPRDDISNSTITRYCHFGVSSVNYSDKMRDVKSTNHGTNWIPNGNSRCYHWLTKSNSKPTLIRKVKDKPLQRISIDGTEIIRNLG